MYPQIVAKVLTVANGAVDSEVELGFIPDYVEIRNRNAADTEIYKWVWGKAMGDGKGWKTTKTTTTHADDTQWATTGGHISALDSATVQSTDPVQIIPKKGIKIANAFHDTNDVIDIVAYQSHK